LLGCNTTYQNGIGDEGIYLSNSDYTIIRDWYSFANYHGAYIETSSLYTTIEDSTVIAAGSGNYQGIGMHTTDHNNITGCTITGYQEAVWCEANAMVTVSNCTISSSIMNDYRMNVNSQIISVNTFVPYAILVCGVASKQGGVV
jgi:hypothetical protein